jgi:hypothetical protein
MIGVGEQVGLLPAGTGAARTVDILIMESRKATMVKRICVQGPAEVNTRF